VVTSPVMQPGNALVADLANAAVIFDRELEQPVEQRPQPERHDYQERPQLKRNDN